MFSYVWPLALVVISNTVYQICAKSVPERVSPFASLTVTYAIGAVVCALLLQRLLDSFSASGAEARALSVSANASLT